jgi:hypothetical protein
LIHLLIAALAEEFRLTNTQFYWMRDHYSMVS